MNDTPTKWREVATPWRPHGADVEHQLWAIRPDRTAEQVGLVEHYHTGEWFGRVCGDDWRCLEPTPEAAREQVERAWRARRSRH